MAKKRTPLVGEIFRKIAPRIGAVVTMEPHWTNVGQIAYKSGRNRYFRFSSLDVNTLGASEIAKDKDYANFFMKRMGYSIVEGRTFFSKKFCEQIGSDRGIDAAYEYALKIGLPVIVKPNSGSQGKGVALVHTKRSFYAAMRRIFAIDKVALVQRRVFGKDYRLVVLDNEVISAYERVPLSVIGDGTSNIRTLLERKQRAFIKSGRDTQIKMDDPRIHEKLARNSLDFASVVPRGEVVPLLDNANLSSGGDSFDVTSTLHSSVRKLAIRLTKDMGLRLCGVDLMLNGDIDRPLGEYWILEINAAPGLDHYAASGKEQREIVENLYLKVLKSMDH